MTKSPKQLPNCLKRAETSAVLIVFNAVLLLHLYYYCFLLSAYRNQVPEKLTIIYPVNAI